MGRDLRYVLIDNEEEKNHFLERANKYVYEGNLEWESINEGRNSVEYMDNRLFSEDELHDFIKQSLEEQDYRQVAYLALIAQYTSYYVVIDSC